MCIVYSISLPHDYKVRSTFVASYNSKTLDQNTQTNSKETQDTEAQTFFMPNGDNETKQETQTITNCSILISEEVSSSISSPQIETSNRF